MNPKQRAAEAAIAYVKSGMVLGLGTGSTANFFLKALADALSAGRLRDIRGIPTSVQSELRARQFNIPLTTLAECSVVDATIDGADEVDPRLDLIKGLGGALTREKILAQNCRQFIIIAEARKRVEVLGRTVPLPVEVVPFGHEVHLPFFRRHGANPVLRRAADGSPFVTDNGNHIYDCRFEAIPDPAALHNAFISRAGIIETGLFVGLAHLALMADEQRVQALHRP